MAFFAAKIWILLWITATLVMLCFAYYARNEAIQKTAVALFLAFMMSHIFYGLVWERLLYVLTDIFFLSCCIYIWRRIEPSNPVPSWVASIFALMLLTHYIAEFSFVYGRALDVLYALQLMVLCRYSVRYGKAAREAL